MSKTISIYSLFLLLAFFVTTASAEKTNYDCTKESSSQFQLDGFHLYIPYAKVNNIYYHADFEYIGSVNNALTWKMSKASIADANSLGSCLSTVDIVGDQVALTDVVAKQSINFTNKHYTANLKLVINDKGVFLSLVDYTVLPNSVKLIMAIANSDKVITLAWEQTESTNTDISYLIYASTNVNFQLDAQNLVKTVKSTGQIELTDLLPSTDYYFRLVTQSKTGDQSIASNLITARTFDKPAVLNSTAVIKQSKNLNLGNIKSIDDNNILFTLNEANKNSLSSGDILIGETEKGGYLRAIESVMQSNGELHLTTSNASLSDIFDTGSLSSSLVLTNISGESQARNKKTKHWKSADASQLSQEKWDNSLLTITQTNHAYADDTLSIIPSPNGHSFNFIGYPEGRIQSRVLTHQLSAEVSINASIDFEPTLETEANWSWGTLDSAKIKATGRLTVNLDVDFNFNGKTSYESPEKRLLTKKYLSLYLIGGIPVWQETTFTLDAQVKASAESEVHAGTNANSSASISVGTRYNGKSWSTISEPLTMQNSITADISIKGKVNAEVRLIPNVEVRFYKVIAGNLSVEPFLNGEIAAESVLYADILNRLFPGFITQMTDFDIKLGLECYVSADLDVIASTVSILDRTKICGKETITGEIEYPLFSLPELSVTVKNQGEQVIATAGAAYGTNNEFNADSVQWFLEPEGPELNITREVVDLELGDDGINKVYFSMSFTPDSDVDAYLVYFSGYGRLGEVARQVVRTDLITTTEEEVNQQKEWCQYGSVSLLCYNSVPFKDESRTKSEHMEINRNSNTYEPIAISARYYDSPYSYKTAKIYFDNYPTERKNQIEKTVVVATENNLTVTSGKITAESSYLDTKIYSQLGIPYDTIFKSYTGITYSCNNKTGIEANNLLITTNESGDKIYQTISPSDCPTYSQVDALWDFNKHNSVLYQIWKNTGSFSNANEVIFIKGLNGTLIVSSSGHELIITQDGTYSFPLREPNGIPIETIIIKQPINQICEKSRQNAGTEILLVRRIECS